MASLTEKIRQFALGIGFDLVGFTSADSIPRHEKALEDWLASGYRGGMAYMARDPSRRANPKQILPEAKSVVCLALNYYTGDHPLPSSQTLVTSGQNKTTGNWHLAIGRYGRVSRYAWGRDYHQVIEEKLERLETYLKQEAGRPVQMKRYVDHGPILERAFASRSGLGFIGKNTLLITREFGSWVFLAELITDLELEPDHRQSLSDEFISQCGNCTLCIEACPTGALIAPYQLDARRCISYLTIENKGEIPAELGGRMGDWIFGCDVCQEVCPYNHDRVPVSRTPELAKGTGPWLSTQEILTLDETDFKDRFQDTPLLRAKHGGLQRNARTVAHNIAAPSG